MQFKDVIGQKEIKHHLIQEVLQDKISHAQLFLGSSGYGSLPLALAFIQYLFCENRQADDSCGTCASCQKVSDLQHPDLHFSFPVVQAISKQSDALLSEWREQVRERTYFSLNQWTQRIDPKGRKAIIGSEESLAIIKKLSLKAYEGGYKVMLIWMAEEMNGTCSNKILKILEEPPANTLFLLLAESQEYMLPTILSRTQIIKIPAIDSDELARHLRKKYHLEESVSRSVSAQTEGNLLEAVDLVEVSEEKDQNRELFVQLMRVCYKKDVIPMFDWAEDISQLGKERQKTFLRYALHMFRQSMLKNYTDEQLIRVSDEEKSFLDKFAGFITGNNVFGFMEQFNEAHYHIDRNANAKILFTNLCFNVMRFIHRA
ncbi:MAG: DNA polymerase III subunit delta [Bacteroidetes bacterium]|nr:MAG: DNA polymerase III subunit delta [Bacteroidota bacterium]